MTTQRAIRSYVVAAVALLSAGLIATIPMRLTAPSPPEVQVHAVDLTTAGFPDPSSLSFSEYITALDSGFADLSSHAQTTVEGLLNSLNTVESDFANSLAGGMSSWGDAFNNLGTDLSTWTTDLMDPTVRGLLETMDPSAGAISLCNVLTFGVEGLQAQLDMLAVDMSTSAAAYSDQIIGGLNSFFDLFTLVP